MLKQYSVTGRGTANYKPNLVMKLTFQGNSKEDIRHKIINCCDLSLNWDIVEKEEETPKCIYCNEEEDYCLCNTDNEERWQQ